MADKAQREPARLPDRLVGGFSHALRNSLNAIALTVMNVERILDREGRSPDLREQLKLAVEEVDIARRSLLGFVELARPLPLDPIDLPLVEVVEAALADHPPARGVAREVDLEPLGDAAIFADPTLLREAFGAVLANAQEAIDASDEGKGTVRVTGELLASGAALIEVADDGPGMTDSIYERCLDGFFTAKAEHQGLGLTRARRILQEHGGDLEVTLGEDRGVIVSMRIPTAKTG